MHFSGDYPRVDARGAWIAARGRNAFGRPMLIGAVGGVTFVAVLLSLVLVPRGMSRAARALQPSPAERVDTMPLLARAERTRRALAVAESSLVRARARVAASEMTRAPAVDTLPPALIARRDTLAAASATLARLIARAETAPLPASYRAIAEAPELNGDPRVRVLLDSLADLEREREAFDAVGGVDPVFVALTARLTSIGRSIQAIAEARHADIRRELLALRPPPPPPSVSATGGLDTLALLSVADAARQDSARTAASLGDARRRNALLDQRAARARELSNVSAPPLALLAASLVLGVIVGFGAALGAELRHPRAANPREVEQVAGVRALAVVHDRAPTPDRQRRRADRETPPLIDSSSQAYRLLYLHFASADATLPLLTVTGDDAPIVATVAANLAAAAAQEARSTLLVDGDLMSGSVAGVLRVPNEPGLAAIIDGSVDWARAIVTTVVGRDRTVDVVPAGAWRRAQRLERVAAERVRRDLARIARRYDLTVLVAPRTEVEEGGESVLPSPDVVLCVRLGHTPIERIAATTQSLRGAGVRLRGVVVWDAELPPVPPRDEVAADRRDLRWTDERVAVGAGR